MALAVPYTDPTTGVHTDTAYARVESVIIDLNEKKILLIIAYYWDQASFQAQKQPLKRFEHVVTKQRVVQVYQPAVLGQVYAYLKTFVEEFSGALDA